MTKSQLGLSLAIQYIVYAKAKYKIIQGIYKKYTGCPREPYQLCFWVTTFFIWTYMGSNIWKMKTELLKNKMSTHSLPEAKYNWRIIQMDF